MPQWQELFSYVIKVERKIGVAVCVTEGLHTPFQAETRRITDLFCRAAGRHALPGLEASGRLHGSCLSPWLRFPSFSVIQPRSVCAGQVSDGVHTVLVTESSFPFEPGALLVWWSSSQPTWKWNPSESRPHRKARASRPGGPGVRAPACARVVQSWVMLRSLSAPCSPGRVGVSGWQETAWCSLSRLDAAG